MTILEWKEWKLPLTLNNDLRVCEQEDCIQILHPSHVVQLLQVLMEGEIVIASAQLNLETRVAAHVRRQPTIVTRHHHRPSGKTSISTTSYALLPTVNEESNCKLIAILHN